MGRLSIFVQNDKFNTGGVDMDNKKIGFFISELRKSKSMTQKELAEKLNLTDKAISKWERGLGYPDITIVSSLADILGVTVNELLNGERMGNEAIACDVNTIVENTLDYADKAAVQYRFRTSNIFIFTISLIFLTSILICVLCDLLISKTISWSIIPSASIVLAWFVIIPIIRFEKNKWIISLANLSLLLVPFLWVVEQNCNNKGWLVPIAVPISIVALIYLWGITYLYLYTQINKWYVSSISTMLIPLLDIAIDIILKQFLIEYSLLLIILSSAIISVIFLYLGFTSENKKKLK